jgi:hypothetical protein
MRVKAKALTPDGNREIEPPTASEYALQRPHDFVPAVRIHRVAIPTQSEVLDRVQRRAVVLPIRRVVAVPVPVPAVLAISPVDNYAQDARPRVGKLASRELGCLARGVSSAQYQHHPVGDAADDGGSVTGAMGGESSTTRS